MQNKISTLLLLLLCLISIETVAQDKFCKKIDEVVNLVNTFHVKSKPLSDTLSANVYSIFINDIDPRKRLLKQSDTLSFSADKYALDDYISKKDCGFINKYADVLKSRINSSKKYLEELSDKPLDYSGKDSLYFDANKVSRYFKDDNEVKRYWNKRVRYELIYKLIENDSVLKDIQVNFSTLEKENRQKIIEKEICLLNELENKDGGILKFVEETFLNAFLKYQDPNSMYFNSSEKSLFEYSVANSQRSFGIYTDKDDNGNIVISYITPGSPALKNGGFDRNDEILALSTKKEEIETNCISNDAIVAFLNNENYNDVKFKIKKKDGTVRTINLTKEDIEIEDNSVDGYIIDAEVPLGYIKISSFYTDLETLDGLGLANDVAKELYLLQRESVKGLIIDLRNNGGGSMKEAAELSGMFIDRGPVAITKDNFDGIYTMKDPNRGMAFYKPIVILVDYFSASASEFFAAALQDYKRAVIVGSNTHGKATAQQIIPLDKSNNLGFAKLTIQKFYRVTGKSHQSIGVIPDIKLPDFYDDFKSGEKFFDYAITNDSVEVKMKHKPLTLNMENLKSKSQLRVSKNQNFEVLKSINKTMVKNLINRKETIALKLEDIFYDAEEHKKLWMAYTKFNKNQDALFTFKNSKSMTERLEYNEEASKLNKIYLNNLAKDIHIQEATNILLDLIKNNQ